MTEKVVAEIPLLPWMGLVLRRQSFLFHHLLPVQEMFLAPSILISKVHCKTFFKQRANIAKKSGRPKCKPEEVQTLQRNMMEPDL